MAFAVCTEKKHCFAKPITLVVGMGDPSQRRLFCSNFALGEPPPWLATREHGRLCRSREDFSAVLKKKCTFA